MPLRRDWGKYLLVFAFGLPFIFYRHGTFWDAYWWTRWMELLCVFSIFFAIYAAKRIHLVILPFLSVALLSAAISAVSPWNESYSHLPPPVYLESARHALYGFITIIGVILSWLYLPTAYVRPVRSFLKWIFWISIIITLVQWKFEKPRLRYGVIGNGGINATVIAALLPLVISPFKSAITRWGTILVSLLVCFMTQTSNGVGAILVSLTCMARFSPWVMGMWGIGLAAGAAIQQEGDGLFKYMDRVEIWRMYYDWWVKQPGHLWWGTGFGTTPALLIHLAQETHQSVVYFFGHSDWLQLGWETGVIGMTSFLIAWGWVVKQSWKRRDLFPGIMTLSAGAIFNFPARVPTSFLVGVALVWLVLVDAAQRRRGSIVSLSGSTTGEGSLLPIEW